MFKTITNKHYIYATLITFAIMCLFVGGLGYLQNKRFEAHMQTNATVAKELKDYKDSLYLTAQSYMIRIHELKSENKELKGKLETCRK